MSNYKRGAAKERATLSKLAEMGCSYVCRVAGSRTEFDVVASNDTHTLYVQVKSTATMPKKTMSIYNRYLKDISAIDNVELNADSLKELWVYPKRARKPYKMGIVNVQFYQRI